MHPDAVVEWEVSRSAFVGDKRSGRLDAKGGVVVEGVVDVSAAVEGLVARRSQMLDDCVLSFQSGMVGTQVYAHDRCSLSRTQRVAMAFSVGVLRRRSTCFDTCSKRASPCSEGTSRS